MEASNIVKNKDVMQSYILTTAKYDFNVYEKRILYRLVELAQSQLNGIKLATSCTKIQHSLFNTLDIEMPISSLLCNEDDKNHFKVKKALDSLQKKTIIYEDDKVWQSFSIISFPKITKRSETISFSVHEQIWDCILNFSKGYRKYELKTAMQLKSIYSMRFYELVSNKKAPITYTIEALKTQFNIEDRYKLYADFKRKVLETAKKELDENSPYTFDYTENKRGRKVVSITFYPIYQPELRDDELETKDLQRQVSLSWFMTQEEKKYLLQVFDFSEKELKNNSALFESAKKKGFSLILFLDKIKPRALRAENIQGYVINALKSELSTLKVREQGKMVKKGLNRLKSTNEPTSIGDLLNGFKK